MKSVGDWLGQTAFWLAAYLILRYAFDVQWLAGAALMTALAVAVVLAFVIVRALARGARARWGLAGALAVWLIVLGGAAAARVAVELSPRAPSPMTAALAAVAVEEWDLALGHLRAAHARQPTDPTTLRLLGLVNARAGGRDAQAIAWLEAYLGAARPAPDARDVATEIRRLDERARRDAGRLLGAALRAADGIPDDSPRAAARDEAYLDAVRAQLALGQAAAARATRRRMQDADLAHEADVSLGNIPAITAAAPLEIVPADPAPWLQLVAEEFTTRPWLADFTREWAAASAADPDARMKALAKAAAETADGLVALRRVAAERGAGAAK